MILKILEETVKTFYKNFSDSQMSPKHDRHRPRYKKMETLDERDSVSFDLWIADDTKEFL